MFLNLERDPRTSECSGLAFHCFQKRSAYSCSPVLRQYCEIVNVDKRPGSKCRKATKARGDTNGRSVHVREKNNGGRMIAQFGYEPCEHIWRQRSPVSHDVTGVGGRHRHNILLVFEVSQVRFNDC
jgi:hypothetical protein